MAENQPPASAGKTNGDASRGMPYYEKLRRDLRETLSKKRKLDQELSMLEDQIYKVETTYLEETTAGNIIKGFDNYIKGSTGAATGGAGAGTATRRKALVSDVDRLFSSSSASFAREDEGPTSAGTTPSHAPTPTGSFPSAGQSNHPTPGSNAGGTKNNKKKKARPGEDEDEKPSKRGKITYARE